MNIFCVESFNNKMINPFCCSASCHRCEITKCVTTGFLADFRELRRYFHRFPLTGRLIYEVIKSFNREETKDFFNNEFLRKSFFISLATLSRRLDFRRTGLSLGREDRLMVCESIVAFWRGIFQLVVA